MQKSLLILVLALFASPALAASVPFCPDSHPGITISFHFGPAMTESEENTIYMMLLKRQGVEVSMVRRWNGCVQAFVRDEDGVGDHLEYYDPRTLERIVLTRTRPGLFGK